MKKIVFLAVAVLMCARLAAAEPSIKLGYVDFERSLNEVEEGKQAKTLLKSEFEEKQKKINAIQDQLTAMKTDLDKQRLILSQDVLKEKEETYRKKIMEFQQQSLGYEQELKSKEAKLSQDILSRLHNIVKEIGEKENYTLILEKSQGVVLYSEIGADLTDRVIKTYNSQKKK